MSRATFNNILKRGSIAITKTSEDGNVEGIKFHLYGTSDSGDYVDEFALTNSEGKAEFNNILIGCYTVEESKTKEYYIVPAEQTVSVVWNEVSECKFYNELKRGEVNVIKSAEDGNVEGIKFHLFGTAANGEYVDVYAVTDEEGVAIFEVVLVGDYTIEEVEAKEYYIIPESQDITVEWDKITQCKFYNELKRGSVTVIKTSEDGKVEGVKFHLFGTSLSGEVVDLYAVTDETGKAVFENVLIGNYKVEEVDTKEYYLIPETHEICVEWNKTVECSFYNELKRGSVKVIKTSEDENVEDVKFHLFGTSLSGKSR